MTSFNLNPLLAINYFAAAVVLVVYPIGIYKALASHRFLTAVLVHLTILTLYGCYYRFRVRTWPGHERVNAFSYVPHALVMPITSGLLMVVAMFTLDSSSWETRGHGVPRNPRTRTRSAWRDMKQPT